ncbi:uncharacterized protein [Gossypium hirsutum]|uniref:Retrotransposon gag domain-containing protein n=1 Tax=Gossypium hirsutum TaxID=3635 RepID=A0A1U8KWN7_GOSHI|nr:uncharacterized protein LOC107921485 [Gossypium hirsutum]
MWDFFKVTFQGKYMGASYVDARRKEFLCSIQGNKTVAEYKAEFLRLRLYAHGIVANEYECFVRFEGGLWDELRVLIAPQRERDFASLVEKVKVTEDMKRSEHQNCEKDRGGYKKDLEPSSFARRHKKKARFDRPIQVGVSVARPQSCADCWRHHLGRGVGNIEVRQPALVYAAHHRKDGDALDVITGTFLIHNVPYTVLIDITHSYVACTVSGTLGTMCENTVNEMIVLSPMGQSVKVDKLLRDGPLEVERIIFLADLMELPFGEFDLILGMNLLVKHRASLDYTAKRMVLKTIEGEEVTVIGERRNFLSNVISTLRAKKLVRKSCEAFLAYIGTFNSEGPSIGDIRTIKDFSDVFPDELPGLPPNREVKFGIELLPGTAPVSIAPYRMAPKEMVE